MPHHPVIKRGTPVDHRPHHLGRLKINASSRNFRSPRPHCSAILLRTGRSKWENRFPNPLASKGDVPSGATGQVGLMPRLSPAPVRSNPSRPGTLSVSTDGVPSTTAVQGVETLRPPSKPVCSDLGLTPNLSVINDDVPFPADVSQRDKQSRVPRGPACPDASRPAPTPANQVMGRIALSGSRLDRPRLFVVDTGADFSILPARVWREVAPEVKLGPPPPVPLSSYHEPFQMEGTWPAQLELGGKFFPITWVVVADAGAALIGRDFIFEHQVRNDFERDCLESKTDGVIHFIPFYRAQVLRAGADTCVKSGESTWVTCPLPQPIGGDVLVEPGPFTQGLLRVSPGIACPLENGTLDVLLSNIDRVDVTVTEGALLGVATQSIGQGRELEYPASFPSGIYRVDSYEEYTESMSKENVENANVNPDLTRKQRKQVINLLRHNRDVFALNPLAPKPYKGPSLKIDTGDAVPIKEALRRASPAKQKEAWRQIQQMLGNDIVEPADSPWGAPIVLATKSDGSYRFCVDYRGLNRVTRKSSYPLPPVDLILDALGSPDAKLFSACDAASGFWHIQIDPPDREKTAFITMYGAYQFRVMPFGLTNAPAVFCRAMDGALCNLLWKCCLVFVDDIIIWSKDFDSHLAALQNVFDALHTAGFSLKCSKSSFAYETIGYLGHVISHGQLRMDPEKLRAIIDYPPPRDVKQLQTFMGMVAWYQRFIQGLYLVAQPLTRKLSKNDTTPWTVHDPETDQGQAFVELKKYLTVYPVLRLPDWDKQFYLITDASGIGCGAVLAQEFEGFELPISYFSKAWSVSERSAHSYVKETKAVVKALKHYRYYFWGSPVVVVTDCRALAHWNTTKEISAVVERYLTFIQSFMPTFIHRAGTLIPTADALSRAHLSGHFDFLMDGRDRAPDPGDARILVATASGLDAEPVRVAQRGHRLTRQAMDYLTDGKFPDKASPTEVEEVSAFSEGLELLNGLLCKRDSSLGNTAPWRPYIPPGNLRAKIVKFFHEHYTAGHRGIPETVAAVESRFYWPSVKSEVETHIRQCASCKASKPARTTKVPLEPLPFTGPWLDIHLDFMEVPRSSKNPYLHLLVIIDRYTRMVELVPTKVANSLVSAQILESEVLNRYGCPITVTTDGGSHFQGEFEELLKANHIKHYVGLPNVHRANGIAERVIRTIREYLRHYASDHNWETFASRCRFAINRTVHRSHGMSPFLVSMGRDPRLPLDNELQLPLPEYDSPILQEASRNLASYQLALRTRYNGKAAPTKLVVGDHVMVRNLTCESKLDVKTYGPYEVMDVGPHLRSNALLKNPFVGPDSRFAFHLEDVFTCSKNLARVLTPYQDCPGEPSSLTKSQGERFAMVRHLLGKEQFSYLDLVGSRISVYWSQAGARGDWPGTIVDFEPRISRFWVKYDSPDRDGVSHYSEDLLGAKPPKWHFL